ncbi:PQQ-binding-like beta-propeller repeat protein, partial [Candidatus Bathyarchaeota archaeon]|nr:PQQ-binding-like beta-propeller repeat protein [Candidatus Bathyarchaeota archaeon]
MTIIKKYPLQTYGPALVFSAMTSKVRSLYWDKDRLPFIESVGGTGDSWGPHRLILDHGATVHAIALSSDGTTLASATHNGLVRIWDAKTGVLEHNLLIKASSMWEFDLAVALSPDGKTLISASATGVIHLWDTASGTCKQTHERDLGSYPMRIFTPDGQKLFLASDEGEISVRDTATGALHQRIKSRGSPCTALACSPEGEYVLTSDKQGIHVWYTATGELGMEMGMRDNDENPTMALAWSRNNRMLASAFPRFVAIWDAEGGPQRSLRMRCSSSKAFTFSPDSKILVSTWKDNISLHDAKTGVHLKTIHGDSDVQEIANIAFSPDSRTLISASVDGTIIFWDMAFALRNKPISDFDMLWGIASALINKTINIFHTKERTSQMLWDIHEIHGMTFSPDGKMIATASGNAADDARIWDVATGKHIRTFRHPRIGLVCFSPDGGKLLSGPKYPGDEVLCLWDVATGKFQQTFRHKKVRFVDFSPDGGTLASGSDKDDLIIKLWDVATGALLQKLEQR